MAATLPIASLFAPDVALRQDDLDEATLRACCRRDPVALRRWVVRYERVVFAFLSRSLGGGPQVEDLAQEVFLRAFQGLSRFDPKGPARFTTWLLAIAAHVVSETRRKGRFRLEPLEDSAHEYGGDGPDQVRHRNELARAFQNAAAQLPEEQRDVFVLAEFHGLTMAEIAAVLEVPENTVKTRLFRAREKLRELLAPVWEA